ncbi:MAG: hypothetical protein P8R31_03955 [Mariniblastus sp.]|nr:hypothetical protein [Mariniblastus sp.]
MPTLNRKSFRSKMALFLSICGALMFAGVDQAKGQPWIKPLDVTQEITDVAPKRPWFKTETGLDVRQEITDVVPIVQWLGVIDLKLRSLLPKSGFVDNTKDFQKLWKAWCPIKAMPMPAVNFDEVIIIVDANTDTSRFHPQIKRDVHGNISSTRFITTLVLESNPINCRFVLTAIPRQGVSMINGIMVKPNPRTRPISKDR